MIDQQILMMNRKPLIKNQQAKIKRMNIQLKQTISHIITNKIIITDDDFQSNIIIKDPYIQTKSKKNINKSMIFGIVVGILVVIAIIVFVIIFILHKKRKQTFDINQKQTEMSIEGSQITTEISY